MAKVDGCQSLAESNAVARALMRNHGEDMADIWIFGCQVALRVSDLMAIKFEHYNYRNNTIVLIESKTGKERVIRPNKKAMAVFNRRSSKYPTDTYLFQSKGTNRVKNRVASYHRNTVLKAFSDVGKPLGLKLGSHSMRKTKATILILERGIPIEKVQALLGHGSVHITQRYLTINSKDIDDLYDEEV